MSIDWTFEVVILPVSYIDASIPFYRDRVSFELDHDTVTEHSGIDCSELMVFARGDDGAFFGFSESDGNTWAVQELKVRRREAAHPARAPGSV